VILIDGDMLVYRVGFACDEEPEKIAIQTMANYISEIISDLSEHLQKRGCCFSAIQR
jgi:hypothetical protein